MLQIPILPDQTPRSSSGILAECNRLFTGIMSTPANRAARDAWLQAKALARAERGDFDHLRPRIQNIRIRIELKLERLGI